jgi:lysozyme family protein
MSRFESCLAWLTGPSIDGGYSDGKTGASKNDHGDASNHGITQHVYTSWRVLKGLPIRSVEGITAGEVFDLYRERYWTACRCNDLPLPLDLVVFDSAVEHGVNRAVKWLQRCAGAEVDGECGDETIYAVHHIALNHRLGELVKGYMACRSAFYAMIIANEPAQKVYATDWKNRTDALAIKIKGKGAA